MKLFQDMTNWLGDHYSFAITTNIFAFIMNYTEINDFLKTSGLLSALAIGILTVIAKFQEVKINKMKIKNQLNNQKNQFKNEAEMD